MGMDLDGLNPTTEAGRAFRNNCWWWRPLARYAQRHAPATVTTKWDSWQYNDGAGMNGADALALAAVLRAELQSGRCAEYAAEYMRELASLRPVSCDLCHGTGKREDMKVFDGCNGCAGRGTRAPYETYYPFSADNVADFVRFLEGCGGFEIW